MRYSKARMIFTSIVSILCLFIIVFLVIKGIDYSKNLTETDVDTKKVVASVSNRKVEESKKAKEEQSKKEKKTSKIKNIFKKTETKKEEETNSEPEEYVYSVSDEDYDPSINGKYKVSSLKIGDKEYSNQELEELLNEGYSLSLDINKYGLATLSVLDLKKMYEVTDEYFDDGIEKIRYSKNIGRIRIKIDDKEILFEKE